MHIDGQCHCGQITYEAQVDPEAVSVCHCTDCQTLTGSPFRVTAICSKADVRLTSGTPKVYGKRGDNGRMRFRLRFSAVHQRRGRSGRGLGHPLGLDPPARQIAPRQADLVPVGGGLDRRGAVAAGQAAGLKDEIIGLKFVAKSPLSGSARQRAHGLPSRSSRSKGRLVGGHGFEPRTLSV